MLRYGVLCPAVTPELLRRAANPTQALGCCAVLSWTACMRLEQREL
jgi:hypothetical protein